MQILILITWNVQFFQFLPTKLQIFDNLTIFPPKNAILDNFPLLKMKNMGKFFHNFFVGQGKNRFFGRILTYEYLPLINMDNLIAQWYIHTLYGEHQYSIIDFWNYTYFQSDGRWAVWQNCREGFILREGCGGSNKTGVRQICNKFFREEFWHFLFI